MHRHKSENNYLRKKMPTQTVTYRTATENDILDILGVIKESFKEYRGKIDPPSSADTKTVKIVQAELAAATAILAEDNGKMVGCVFCQPKEGYMYLDRLSVLPACRRMGIAGRLIDLVEQRAIEQSMTAIRLSVRISLVDNQAYYQKKGYEFKQYGTHSGYNQPTYVVLEKQLSPRSI